MNEKYIMSLHIVMLDLLVVLQVLSWKLLLKVRNDIIFLERNAHLYVQQVVLSYAEFVMSRFCPPRSYDTQAYARTLFIWVCSSCSQ